MFGAGEVLGVCMCGSHQRGDVQRWIGTLQEKYSSLAKANIIYDITELDKTESSGSKSTEQPKIAAP